MKVRVKVRGISGTVYHSTANNFTENEVDDIKLFLAKLHDLDKFSIETEKGEIFFNPRNIESISLEEA